jgi:hypothetical protein
MNPMRIIITGVSHDGETVVVADKPAQEYGPVTAAFDSSFVHIFGSDAVVALPSDGGAVRYGPGFFPGPGGFRFWLFTVPAQCAVPPAQPGGEDNAMAYADTVEWVTVLSGQIDHILPGGRVLNLATGDSVVQIGAKHRWVNRSDAACTMAVAAIGAKAAQPSPWMNVPVSDS